MNKKIIIGLLLLVIFSGTVYASTLISADQIIYSREGSDVTTVGEAVDELYSNCSKGSNSNLIKDTIIIDSTNNNGTWTYDQIPAGDYVLYEYSNLYKFNTVSSSSWNIGSFSTSSGTPTNGISEGSGLYTFTLTEPATPSVTIYNYYPTNLNAQNYYFYLVRVDKSDSITVDSTNNNTTINLGQLDSGNYILFETYVINNGSYNLWDIGNFSSSSAYFPMHGDLLISASPLYIYSFELKETANMNVYVHSYSVPKILKYWVGKIN